MGFLQKKKIIPVALMEIKRLFFLSKIWSRTQALSLSSMRPWIWPPGAREPARQDLWPGTYKIL